MNDQLVVMNEINREIKDLEVAYYDKLFKKALIDMFNIAMRKNIQNVGDDIKKQTEDRLLLIKKDLERISKLRESMNNEKGEKIEKLKDMVIKQTNTAALLDPLRSDDYWQRLHDAGFYDDTSDRIVDKYVRKIYRLLEQQNTAD